MASSEFPPGPSNSHANNNKYTARLLLFSTSNVDKRPKPSDPSIAQRTEMMLLLARRLSTSSTPVAIGLLNQATFAGKARVVHKYLRHANRDKDPPLDVRLTFLIGTDTLTRFVEPKYYASQGGMSKALDQFFDEGSTVVSVRRGGGEKSRRAEEAVLARQDVRPWVDQGKLRLLGDGDEEWVGISSTSVRESLVKGDREGSKALVMDEVAEYVEQEKLYE
ncbi:MAG: hypothetical protein TREMPRED_005355 [Tremellales sp. Tagirdzhanova-0007]|nr:MAG: hypothetical protein TREMPRED_005355 [Tremellales sp. Tagirdzhanova-0007]